MAYTLNQVMLLGRLTSDPQQQANPQSESISCRFTIAINNGKDNEGNDRPADFPNVVCWGKLADYAKNNLVKGQRCYIQGKLKTSSYTKDGEKKYITQVVAASVIPLDKAKQEGVQNSSNEYDGFIPDADIPF